MKPGFATSLLLFPISHEGGGGGGLAYLWRCAPWVVSPALSRMGRHTLEPACGVLRLAARRPAPNLGGFEASPEDGETHQTPGVSSSDMRHSIT